MFTDYFFNQKNRHPMPIKNTKNSQKCACYSDRNQRFLRNIQKTGILFKVGLYIPLSNKGE